jgi:hypothetical protein
MRPVGLWPIHERKILLLELSMKVCLRKGNRTV